MTNVTMPEPVAWIWDTGTNRGLTWTKSFPPDEERVTSSPLIPTDQAEAYANGRVREALEEAAMILKANAEVCHSDTARILRANAEAIRALIPKEPPCET